MANTITYTGRMVNLTAIDTDWKCSDSFPGNGIKVHSIKFIPAAANDKCVIKDALDTGAVIFQATAAAATDEKIEYFGGLYLCPMLDVSAGSYNAAARVVILVE